MLLGKIVERALVELEKDYRRFEETYLTEGDVVASLLCSLRNLLEKESGRLTVHAQLRPYKRTREGCMVLKEVKRKIEWAAQRKASEGTLLDVAVTDLNNEYWRETYTKALEDQHKNRNPRRSEIDLKYWRMLSCPVEAFKAAIEIKIRLWGNHQYIKRDIDKLAKLRENEQKLFSILPRNRPKTKR